MSHTALLAFVLSVAVTLAVSVEWATPDRVVLDLARWTCTDREPDGCAEWRRDHEHELPRSAKR